MKSKYELARLSVFEAIEALERIAELPIDSSHLTQAAAPEALDEQILAKRIEWLNGGNVKNTHLSLKGILTVVLNYLKGFYKNEPSKTVDPHAIEGIKTIMVLVGEAAKKIDLYTSFFHQTQMKSITQLKEYKQLQELYRKRVVRQIDDTVLGKWVLDIGAKGAKRRLESEEFAEHKSSRYLFVDLDALKHDIEYDLLFIRKEDGSHFFSPGLIRNMKLVCNFSAKAYAQDPLLEIKQWQDNCMCNGAKNILRALEHNISRFYRDAFRFRHREIVAGISNCLMALMLCGTTTNLKEDNLVKSCRDYFFDFQFFLRELLLGDQYHHLIAYPPSPGNKVNVCALELVHAFCRAIFLDLHFFHFLAKEIQKVIESAISTDKSKASGRDKDSLQIAARLSREYTAVEQLLKSHPSGPLRKLLEAFEEDGYRSFDPLLQRNFPSLLFSLAVGEHRISNIHLPSPTHQEYIHKAAVIDEFKAFLHACASDHSCHLLINLQDRTAWKEHARSVALEELALAAEFKNQLVTISLAKDTDFYHQLPPYAHNNQYHSFLEQFKAHFGDKNSGYSFPPSIEINLLSFIDPACSAIHRVFFFNKNVLLQEHRLSFIEIFDLFLVLKLLDLVKPASFSFSCKDGIDFSTPSSTLLFLFLKLLGPLPFAFDDWERVNSILYAPAFLVRERVILHERFQRMVSAFKVIEFVYRDVGHEIFGKIIREAFGRLYSEEILHATLLSQ